MNPTPSPADLQSALCWVERRRRAEAELEVQRLQALRALGELESAQRFVHLLGLTGPYPLRGSCGLV